MKGLLTMTRGEKITWIFFAATSMQLAFQQPSLILMPGERTNLFSGLWCFLTLMVAILCRRPGSIRLKSPEFLISLSLTVMAVLSGLCSITPFSSSLRVLVLLASGLGGFWCARLLLDSPANQQRFQGLCLLLFAGIVLLSLAGYYASSSTSEGGRIYYFLRVHPQPLTSMILLLSFAPLALLRQASSPLIWAGIILLGLGFAALCLSMTVSVVLIPIVLVVLGTIMGTIRLKHLLLVLIPLVVTVGLFRHQIPWSKLTNKAHLHYRLENYAFSWHIAKQHPLLGIGVRAPRENFLAGYQLAHPYVSHETFAENLADIVSADNNFLTLMTGLGLPFVITYSAAVIMLLVKLVGLAYHPPPGLAIHPLLLLFPVVVGLVQFQLFDGLLFPQNCWFFHIFLGLIPLSTPARQGQEEIAPRHGCPPPPEPTTKGSARVMGTATPGFH